MLGPVSPIRLKDFPQDRVERKIMSIGPLVRRGKVDAEPLWRTTVALSERGEKVSDFRRHFHIPTSYVRNLRIGSTWVGKQLLHPTGDINDKRELQVDGQQQSIVIRQNDPLTDEPVFYPEAAGKRGATYVKIAILGNPECDWAVIRCSELMRVYFGSIDPLARYAFDFGPDGRNDFLFLHENTRVLDDGRFQISRVSKVNDADAKHIAAMLFLKPTRKALLQLSGSARAAHLAGVEIWPKMSAPIDGPNKWTVFGRPKQGRFVDEAGEGAEATIFGVTQLLNSHRNYDLPGINIEHPGREPYKNGEKRNDFKRPSSKPSQKTPQLSSDQSPGNRVRLDHLDETFRDINQGLNYGKVTKSRRITMQVAQSAPTDVERHKLIDTYSNLTGGTGDGDVGLYRSRRQEAEMSELAADKPHATKTLAGIRNVAPVEEYISAYGDVPPRFDSLIEATLALELHKNLSDATFSLGGRQALSKEYESALLFHLPSEWGNKTKSSCSETGIRRALWLDIQMPGRRIAILDVEGRNASEKVSAHIYGFTESASGNLDIRLISKLLHQKVYGKGWSRAEEYQDPIFSLPLNHVSIKKDNHMEILEKRVRVKLIHMSKQLRAA